MTLRVEDFDAYFAGVNGGWRPFSWQRRLLRRLVDEGRWPERIAAPTGSGKTAVIDIHVFAVALMASGIAPTLPRRLSLVVDRRALVDSHADRARRLNETLSDAATGSDAVLRAVAETLLGLPTGATTGADPFIVSVVRGGGVPDTGWRDEPSACAVLCATPDMWGSRLLLRGYGTSRHARPREAGLLAYDSVVVVDEAHLNRQLLVTARRIAALESKAGHSIGRSVLQVVETTATPHPGGEGSADWNADQVVSVEPEDLANDSALDARLRRPKPCMIIPVPGWPSPTSHSRRALAGISADEVVRLHTDEGPTVGCVVNTVDAAILIDEELRGRGLTVELLVGRLRPWDVRDLHERRPNLLTPVGDPEVDVLVATQTVEVGVDADFSALVTEMAPGSALAQRAGRVNRIGTRAAGPIVVVGPSEDATDLPDAPPYRGDDLDQSMTWLRGRLLDAAGFAPWVLRDHPPPPQLLRRTLLARPEPWDAWYLSRTSDHLVAEPELDRWLADDLEVDHDAGLVVRQGLPHDIEVAVALLRATPPRAPEVFPARIGMAARVLDAHPDEDRYVFREDEVFAVDLATRLRPGDIVIVGTDMPCFRSGVVDVAGLDTATDVYEQPFDDREPLTVRLVSGAPSDPGGGIMQELLAGIGTLTEELPKDGRPRRTRLARLLDTLAGALGAPQDQRVRDAAQRLTKRRLIDVEVVIGLDATGETPVWVVVADTGRWLSDEELRQTWTRRSEPVALTDHQHGVARRVADIASRLQLDDSLVELLRTSGILHDEGKRDERFQSMLRGSEEPHDLGPLAKSGARSPSEARAAIARSGLPGGWRHEQLSAVHAWSQPVFGSDADRSLVTRLVGTSHGRGRSCFPHDASGLVGTVDSVLGAARDLYDEGAWDAVIERTEADRGVWGCAYLEALLRAADGQVSGEGG